MKKHFIIFLTFFTLFNGLVWDKLFKGYREYYMEMIDSLEDDRVRLQLKIDEDIDWIGGECARLLDLDIAGVDLLFDKGKYVICEVNSAPGFQGMEKYTKINVAEQMVDFIVKKVGRDV